MITLRVDAETMARARFSYSPALEAVAWLKATVSGAGHPVFGDPGPLARAALAHPDVALLAQLVPPLGRTYIPDLLTPQPGRGSRCAELLDEQLAAIEGAGQEDLEFQVLDGIPAHWDRPAAIPVQRAARSGELPRRLAAGLARFWRETLAELWPTVQPVLEQDLAERAMTLVSQGMGRVLNTAHPGIAWTGEAITLAKPWTGEIDLSGRDLVLAPGVLTWPEVLVQGPAEAVLHFPARRVGTAAPAGPDLGAVIGDTRALLLAELGNARSTTDLARRLGYTPGTISYHLSAMHRVGLVSKSRDGRFVLYRRTSHAHALLHEEISSARSPRRRSG